MKRDEERREGITDADDTGLIAGEQLITQAETLLPLREFPHQELHAALPDAHPAHATIDRLHAEVHGSAPDVDAVRQHVGALRALPQLEAAIANWWDDPRTQRVILDLGQIGL